MGNLGGLSPQGSVAVGVVVGLISTSLQAIGLTLQRKSHMLEDEKHPFDIRRPPYKRRRWQLGMLMFVSSNIVGSTIQITTLPLPVLSTLQASGLVFNTAFATLMLGEPFTRYSLFGTVLVCGGAVLIATFGAIGEPAHTLDQLLQLLQRRIFILWMVGTGIVALVILLGSHLLKLISGPSRSKHATLLYCRIQLPYFHILPSRVKVTRGMCYGLVSGILSAHSLLLAKSAVELLVRTIVDRANQFNRWQSWMILMSMLFFALTQLFYLHRGLKLCSTSILYPFVFCVYNVIAILDGLIYFRQASQLAGLHAGLIALGTTILLAGVLCLSWRLEDMETHAGVSVAGPSQTGLGPAIGTSNQPESLDGITPDDEEAQPGERDSLLRFPPLNAPTFPLMTPHLHPNSSSAVNPESIWAELDDSDCEYRPHSSEILKRPSTEISQRRSRSQSGTQISHPPSSRLENGIRYAPIRGGARHSQVGIQARRTWDGRRSSAGWRRTSAPVVNTVGYRRNYGFWHPYFFSGTSSPRESLGTATTLGYGSIPNPERAGRLAGSRRTAAAWKSWLHFLRKDATSAEDEGSRPNNL